MKKLLLLCFLVLNSGCNPLGDGQSATYGTFAPGIALNLPSPSSSINVPFQKTLFFTYGSDLNYIIDPQLEISSGNVCRLKNITQADNTSAQFLLGTRVGVVYGPLASGSGTGLLLGNDGTCNGSTANCAGIAGAARSGSFTSRIFDGSSMRVWNSISWKSSAPFLKSLPDAGPSPSALSTPVPKSEIQADYVALASSTLMNGNVGLWHLDETSGLLRDSSGYENHGVATGSAGSSVLGITGKLGQAIQLDGIDGAVLTADEGQLNFGANDFTLSAWVKSTASATYEVAVSKLDGTQAYFLSLTIGYPTFSTGTGTTVYDFSVNIQNDNLWHHLVGVRNAGMINVYTDGVSGTTPISSSDIDSPVGPLTIGQFGNVASANWPGSLDEIAIWNRGLSPGEIKQLYQRGASRIKFQVRSCTNSTCNNGADPWHGPDGSASTYFSELDNTTLYNLSSNLPGGNVKAASPELGFANFATPAPLPNRYFQYRAYLESDSNLPSLMPELESVSIGPTYDPTSPTVIGKSGTDYKTLSSFTQTLGSAGCSNGLQYNLGIGTDASTATWYFWESGVDASCSSSGSGAWCVAGLGAFTANPASIIFSNLSSFPVVPGTKVYTKAFLNSDGATGCELSRIDLQGEN